MSSAENVVGQKFGKLTIVKFSHSTGHNRIYQCSCDCGNTVLVKYRDMASGIKKSCGCQWKTKKNAEPVKIKVGTNVELDPFEYIRGFCSEDHRGSKAIGTVVMVNEAHQWFSVEFGDEKNKQRTSFKFCEIGKVVKIIA